MCGDAGAQGTADQRRSCARNVGQGLKFSTVSRTEVAATLVHSGAQGWS